MLSGVGVYIFFARAVCSQGPSTKFVRPSRENAPNKTLTLLYFKSIQYVYLFRRRRLQKYSAGVRLSSLSAKALQHVKP